jgi:D-glycero-D-manno-heptose 1,7-bisphosphate phosphatase
MRVMNPAVFLDRDGTLNEEVGYVNHLARLHLIPGAAAAVRLINQSGFKAVVVTNQSGVARGYFPESLVWEVHEVIERRLREEEAYLDRIYYCPHLPRGAVKPYNVECECRKPKDGMLRQAAKELGIDLGRSYVVGDRLKDVEFAQRAGLKGILVLTGYGKGEAEYILPTSTIRPDFVAEDLYSAGQFIVADVRRRRLHDCGWPVTCAF